MHCCNFQLQINSHENENVHRSSICFLDLLIVVLGGRQVCIEKRGSLGGTCLNVGCIPSKVSHVLVRTVRQCRVRAWWMQFVTLAQHARLRHLRCACVARHPDARNPSPSSPLLGRSPASVIVSVV